MPRVGARSRWRTRRSGRDRLGRPVRTSAIAVVDAQMPKIETEGDRYAAIKRYNARCEDRMKWLADIYGGRLRETRGEIAFTLANVSAASTVGAGTVLTRWRQKAAQRIEQAEAELAGRAAK